MLWACLDADSIVDSFPQINRALSTLQQIERPFAVVENPTNAVIGWRILFPVVAHWSRMPREAFLALPALGCLLALTYCACVMQRQTGDAALALAATTLTATTSWFFISTGWLAYFDAWYVLALLVLTFSESRAVVAIVCLLAPWIDERFVLAAPFAFAVRMVVCDACLLPPSKCLSRRDFAAVLAPLGLYAAIRLAAVLVGGDTTTQRYLDKYLAEWHAPVVYLSALWHALRAAWVAMLIMVWLAFDRRRHMRTAFLIISLVGALIACLLVAADLSRSVSVVAPAVPAGLILFHRHYPKRARCCALAMAVCNLLLPAKIVVTTFTIPLHSAVHEFSRWHDPNALDYLAQLHLHQAMRLAESGRFEDAWIELGGALRLAPRSPDVFNGRAAVLQMSGDRQGALVEFQTALLHAPGHVNTYVNRSQVRRALGDLAGAIADLETALELAPDGAPVEMTIRHQLARLREAADQ